MRLQSARPRLPDQEVTKQPARILEAAKIVFLRDGGAKFSARRVAKQARVGLSTVQHFFSTTEELQLAMLEYVERVYYQEVFQEMGAKLPFAGAARLRGVIDYLIDGLFKPATRRFYFGFWSLSCHNDRVERFLTESYSHYRDNLAVLIGAANPALSEERCHDLATHVAALIEGLLIFIVPTGKRFGNRNKIIQSVKQSIWTLISTEPVQDWALRKPDATRDGGAQLLASVRERRAGKAGHARRVPMSEIAQARTRTGLSRQQFAKVLGVSMRTLQEWEQGRRQLSGAARSLLAIAARRPEILREIIVA